VQEYSSYYFVTGEDNPDNDRNNSTEGIQKIEDHSMYYLVDTKNKGERIKIKKIHSKIFLTKWEHATIPSYQMEISRREQMLSH
jgi:hypothetical protein